MKKLSILLMMLIGICTCFAASAYAVTGVSGELEYIYSVTPTQSFIFDENPKAEVQTYLADSAVSNYQLRLYVDEVLTDIIAIRTTGGKIEKNTYEFPIYEEGQHTVKLEFVKDGVVADGATNAIYEATFTYVKSVGKGYSERGFAGHWGHGTNAYDAYDAQFYKAIGADVVRDGVSWKAVETVAGKYVYTNYDNLLNPIFQIGVNPIFVLNGTNPLYINDSITRDSISKTNSDGAARTEAEIDAEWEKQKLLIRTDAQIEAYANFALDVAKHYPTVKKFEIQNEPGFNYTGAEYAKLVLAAAKKLKEYDPEIEVYVGSLIDNDNGVETRLDFAKNFFTPEIYPYVDAMCFHIYTANQYAENTKWNSQSKDYVDEIAAEGGWKSLTVTEMGWPVGTWAQTPAEKQASELVKRTVISDGINIDFITLYEFKNSGTDTSNYEHMLGILSKSRTPNPAYYSMQEYFRRTGKAQFIGKAYLTDGMKAYAYSGNDGNFLIVWAENNSLATHVKNDDYKSVSYTFADDVTITDMYGKQIEGKTVTPTYAPMYVHGLSQNTFINLVGANGTDDVLGDLGALCEYVGYTEKYAQLEALYNAIISEKTYDAIEEYVNYCYDFGEILINHHKLYGLGMTEQRYSYFLSELNDAAEFGARLVAACDVADVYDATDEFMTEYNRIRGILNISDRVGVRYLSEPYEVIRDIQKKLAKYEGTSRINPIDGENYHISETGILTFSGTAAKKSTVVSVKISENGEVKYLTTLDTSKKKEYSGTYKLPAFGTYTLEIYDGEKREEEVVYQKNGYISVEDKMTTLGNIRSERLLRWSKLLMADYLETQKGYILPIDVEKNTVDGKLVLDYSDTEYDVFVAVSNADGLVSVTEKNSDGNCIVDVSGLSDYTVKVYVWKDLSPKSKVIEY